MSRNSRDHKEYTRLQEALHENKKLKRENSSLRKQLARLDLDRHSYVKDIVDEHLAQEDQSQTTTQTLESLKNTWKCLDCKSGFLEIHLYTKVGETWYWRQCNSCEKRTKSQQYDPDKVKGIVKNDPKTSK